MNNGNIQVIRTAKGPLPVWNQQVRKRSRNLSGVFRSRSVCHIHIRTVAIRTHQHIADLLLSWQSMSFVLLRAFYGEIIINYLPSQKKTKQIRKKKQKIQNNTELLAIQLLFTYRGLQFILWGKYFSCLFLIPEVFIRWYSTERKRCLRLLFQLNSILLPFQNPSEL